MTSALDGLPAPRGKATALIGCVAGKLETDTLPETVTTTGAIELVGVKATA